MTNFTEFPQQRSDALAWLASAASDREADRSVAPYLDAAAVLSTFKLDSLQPVGLNDAAGRTEALIEMTNRCRAVGDPQLDTWQIQESFRHVALRRLGDRRAMRAARAANPTPAADPLQEGIDFLIKSEDPPNLSDLSLDQLLGVERAARWLEGIITPLPSKADLAACIERERQLAPMRKVAGEGFVDRENYLSKLADYVGTLPSGTVWQGLRRGFKYVAYLINERPPLHLFGPGGIGKSALLARFILDHTNPRDNPHPLPFVYLDFDRAVLDPREPQTILEDSIRQLLIQFPFPFVGTELASLGDEARENVAQTEGVEFAKGRHYEGYENLVRRFCRLLEEIATRNDQPVLIMLDTLEEAEYQGRSALFVTWGLLADLLRRVDRLRIITAGRSALPPGLEREPVELVGLPIHAAEQFVIRRTEKQAGGPISIDDAREIVSIVGTVPLSLALAAHVVLNEGVAGLRDTVSRRRIFSRIKAEQQQGMLYRRILNHVRVHDPVLERVANPGLVLRRITPAIIEQVLAGPCGLDLQHDQHAQNLFDELGREVGLVDPYREPGALWHIPAVRRIMLPELLGILGELATLIHAAAARYYHGRPSAIERAEEIYHRLWLGEDAPELNKLWSPELQTHLRGAYEELKPRAKIWLGDKLGIELEEGLRAQASFEIWERQTEQRARTLMSSGFVSEALAALRERERSQAPSSLYVLEADALKLMGRLDEAQTTLEVGLSVAERAGDRGAMLPLVLRMVFLYEATGDLAHAWSRAVGAVRLAGELLDPLELLSSGAAVLRLARKLEVEGGSEDATRQLGLIVERRAHESFLQEIRSQLLALVENENVRAALRSRPALFAETAAELGRDNVGLLAEAISLLGIEPEDLVALGRHAQGSEAIVDSNQRDLLERLQRGVTSRGIGQTIAELVPLFPDFFRQRLNQSVEDSLRRTVSASPGTQSPTRVTGLSGQQLDALESVVARDFTHKEMELLTLDSFDVRLDEITNLAAPLRQQVHELFLYADGHGSLDRFVTRLGRSRPDDAEIQQLLGGML